MRPHHDKHESPNWEHSFPRHDQELHRARKRVEASALQLRAAEDRLVAAILRSLGAAEVTPLERRNCLSRVGSHPWTGEDRAWMKLPRDASPDRVLAVLLGMLDAHFESLDHAASLLVKQAEYLEVVARRKYEHAAGPCPTCRPRTPGEV